MGMMISSCKLHAQAANFSPFYLKIKTDSGVIKNVLWSVGDSGISLSRQKIPEYKYIKATDILYIKVKRPLFTTPLIYMLTGAVAGGILVWPFIKNRHDNSDFKILIYSIAAGGSVGLMAGLAEGIFFKLKISIKKSQQLFELNRSRLQKYVTY